MNCPRCASPAAEEDLRRFGGVCLDCAYAFAAEEEAPAIPNLEIGAPIGRGGMGVVYRAVQTHLGRTVAVKILAPRFADRPEFIERFLREAKMLAQLSHPGIVTVFDAAVHDGTPYLVMELVDGVSLRRLALRERLSPSRAASIAARVAEALQYAHERGVIHRDVKPENILIGHDGRVKLADFGLARLEIEEGPRLTRPGVALGTPAYMAPEQIESSAVVDSKADLYAIGVVLYELLTGSLPFGRFKAPSALVPLDGSFDDVVLGLLEKEPSKRGSAGELVEKLSRLASVSSAPTVPLTVRPRWRPGSLVLPAVVVLLSVIGGIVALSGPREEPGWVELGGSATGEGVSRGVGPSSFASMALDRRGYPMLAWDGGPSAKPEIYFRRWDGERWAGLGGSDTGGGVSNNPGMSQEASLAADPSGNPVVAWRDDSSGNWEIYLRRWNGTAWVELDGSGSAGGVSRTPGASWGPSVQVDRHGHPVVTWHDATPGNSQVYLRRWDGERWTELGGSAGGGGLSRTAGLCMYARLALDADDRPVVAWHDFAAAGQSIHLLRWNGAAWKAVGGSDAEGGISGGGDLAIGSLKLDAKGNPAVTWVDKESRAVHFRRWTGSAWEEPGGADLSGTKGSVVFSTFDFDPAGRPVVAWMDESSGNPEIYLKAWSGSSWGERRGSASGGGVSRSPGESAGPALTVDSEGRVFVAWHDSTPTVPSVQLRRLNPAR